MVDLMKESYVLSELIESAMSDIDIATLRQIGPALDANLRVARQIDRFAQVEIRRAAGMAKAKERVRPRRLR